MKGEGANVLREFHRNRFDLRAARVDHAQKAESFPALQLPYPEIPLACVGSDSAGALPLLPRQLAQALHGFA
jgi:hypothetical protein